MEECLEKYRALRAQQNAERRRAKEQAFEALTSSSGELIGDVREGVAQLYANQKRIKELTIEMSDKSEALSERMAKWVAKYNSLNESLRGLGDIRHWAQSIRQDLVDINQVLYSVCESQRKRRLDMITEQQISQARSDQSHE